MSSSYLMPNIDQHIISPLPYPTDTALDHPNFTMTTDGYPLLHNIPVFPGSNGLPQNQDAPPSSCSRKHPRSDSRGNGLDDLSTPEIKDSAKRSRTGCDSSDGSVVTPTDKNTQSILGSESNVSLNGATSDLTKQKKTKGRVKINMEYIPNKLRRYTTFSKRKSGIMKKAFELSTLTGTQVMLLVASETGHVYTFATPKLQPMITSERGKALIQTCLNSPDPHLNNNINDPNQRMNIQGYEEMDLNYPVSNGLMEDIKDVKHLFSDPQMHFPHLAGLSHINASQVLQSPIQMLSTPPAVQLSPPGSGMTYIHNEVVHPSSLNVPILTPTHSPRNSPVIVPSSNNLIVQHNITSRTPSPHTKSPSHTMIASSPANDGFRTPLISNFSQNLSHDTSIVTSPLTLTPEYSYTRNSPTSPTRFSQAKISPSISQQIAHAQQHQILSLHHNYNIQHLPTMANSQNNGNLVPSSSP